MKVKELIKKLLDCDQEMEIKFVNSSNQGYSINTSLESNITNIVWLGE